MSQMKLLLAFIYLLLYLVILLKWLPDIVSNLTPDPIYQSVLNIGVAVLLLVPLYLIFTSKK